MMFSVAFSALLVAASAATIPTTAGFQTTSLENAIKLGLLAPVESALSMRTPTDTIGVVVCTDANFKGTCYKLIHNPNVCCTYTSPSH